MERGREAAPAAVLHCAGCGASVENDEVKEVGQRRIRAWASNSSCRLNAAAERRETAQRYYWRASRVAACVVLGSLEVSLAFAEPGLAIGEQNDVTVS
jgi:hypothetical protein